jgi:hypothetical protein
MHKLLHINLLHKKYKLIRGEESVRSHTACPNAIGEQRLLISCAKVTIRFLGFFRLRERG